MQKNRCVPDVAEQRELWKQAAKKFDPDQLVFLDESGVNTDLTSLCWLLPMIIETALTTQI